MFQCYSFNSSHPLLPTLCPQTCTGSSNAVLCDNPEVGDRLGGRRKVHKGWDIHIPMADSSWYMVQSNYPPI